MDEDERRIIGDVSPDGGDGGDVVELSSVRSVRACTSP